jgi:vitamin B12 transporter
MRAIHNTLTYHVKPHKLVTVNLAAYHKKYSRLPLQFSENHYQALGHGYAYGLDSEIKFQNSRFQGWLTYSYLDSKRLWKNFEHLSPSSFAVAHTLTLITKMDLGYAWQVGINFKTASGRPYTPIHSAEYDKEYNIYIPQYGSPNSHHYPSYHRLDFRLLYLRNFYKDWFTVFYLEAMNLLNIANTMNYSYAPDYSSRSPIRSFFSRRTIVFGVTVTL